MDGLPTLSALFAPEVRFVVPFRPFGPTYLGFNREFVPFRLLSRKSGLLAPKSSIFGPLGRPISVSRNRENGRVGDFVAIFRTRGAIIDLFRPFGPSNLGFQPRICPIPAILPGNRPKLDRNHRFSALLGRSISVSLKPRKWACWRLCRQFSHQRCDLKLISALWAEQSRL